MARYKGRNRCDYERRDRGERKGSLKNQDPRWQGRMSDDRYRGERPLMRAGEEYGGQYRSSDRMDDRISRGRMTGRESDLRPHEQPYDRYGMENEDWRHMDDYWETMYGDEYPHEKEWNRAGGMGMYAGRGPRNYKRSDERIQEDVNEQLTLHPGIDATDIEVSVHEGDV